MTTEARLTITAGRLVAKRAMRYISRAFDRAGIDHEWRDRGGLIERDLLLIIRGDKSTVNVAAGWVREFVDGLS